MQMKTTVKMLTVAAGVLAATFVMAQDVEIVKVRGKGTGADRAEALKDAYRDAVERAVGMYVDAEQMVKNDELVNDQILTQSNAYIEKCDVVKEVAKPNGIVEVQILAEVKKSALTKKISDVMPRQTFSLGDDMQNMHSRIVTKEKRNIDAAALLENVIGGFDPVKQLMILSLASSKSLRAADKNGKEKLYYRFRFTVNEEKYYNEFLPSLLKVLDQIALSKPKDLRLRAVDLTDGDPDPVKKKTEYIDGKWKKYDAAEDGHTKFSDYHYNLNNMSGIYAGDIGFTDGKGNSWCFSNTHSRCNPACEYFNVSASGELAENGLFRILVITKVNELRSIIKAREYALPPECANVVLKWYQSVITATPQVRYSEQNSCKTTYNIVFSDKRGEEVVAMPVSFVNRTIANVFLGNLPYFSEGKGKNYKCQVALFVSPMVHCDAASLEEWIGFDIPLDQLPNIKSVTVELAE